MEEVKEKKNTLTRIVTNCGVMLIIFAFIAYFINLSAPISSSWAYIYVVGPIVLGLGVVVLVIGLLIGRSKIGKTK